MSRGLGDVYKRQVQSHLEDSKIQSLDAAPPANVDHDETGHGEWTGVLTHNLQKDPQVKILVLYNSGQCLPSRQMFECVYSDEEHFSTKSSYKGVIWQISMI